MTEKSETLPLSVYLGIIPIDAKSSPGVINISRFTPVKAC